MVEIEPFVDASAAAEFLCLPRRRLRELARLHAPPRHPIRREDGEGIKRFGFHSFRHSLTSWLMANGENPQVVRAMLRWTSLNMLAHYTHGFSNEKLEAQGAVLKKIVPERVRQRVQAQSA